MFVSISTLCPLEASDTFFPTPQFPSCNDKKKSLLPGKEQERKENLLQLTITALDLFYFGVNSMNFLKC